MSDNRESILARIRALMAKTTDNGCTEAEAKLAAAKVDELLAKYEIDLDEVHLQKQDIIQAVVDGAAHPVGMAATAIAKFCDCKIWLTGNSTKIVYFGFQVDTEIAEYLTLLFKRAIDRESAAYLLFNPEYDAANKRGRHEMQASFGIGMARRLGERLRELKSKRDFSQRETNGRALVILKQPLIDAAFAELGLVLGRAGKGPKINNMTAFAAGQNAAAHVRISQGVADRAQRSGGILA